jgi:hypothetical protein
LEGRTQQEIIKLLMDNAATTKLYANCMRRESKRNEFAPKEGDKPQGDGK